ncbi:MAG TPA: response regulator [Vicinamibacteria bacterium]|nr:response regulator [Vicinamibacteria bacterium]
MSLSGSVEDLPLLEILQVVAFCRKTGHLTVRTPAGEVAIVFDSGRVVSGYAWDVPGLPRDRPEEGPARELVIRQRLASLLERLVRLREGEFAFNLTDAVPATLGGRDLGGERLPYGINPEELMLDLARQLDEDRRAASATLEASFAAPDDDEIDLEQLPLEEPPASPSGPAVVLLDDEPDIRRVLGDRLAAAGFDVACADSPAVARREMDRLAAAGTPFLIVADLAVPSDSGASFHGGLDVAKAAAALSPPPPVLIMAETFDDKLRARARRLGVSLLVFKPGLSKLDPLQYEADLRAFGDKLARDLLPRLAARQRAMPGPVPAPGEGPADGARAELLKSALEEMQRNPDPDLVAFLLLRAARSFFPRVLLFLAKDDRLRGLSGFGPVDSGDSLDLLAREISLPLDRASVFSEAVATGRSWAGPLPADGPVRALLDRIGPMGATAAAVLPLRSNRETIAVLYGDAPEGGELPPLGPLLEFVERAGRALDQAFLSRRAPSVAAC